MNAVHLIGRLTRDPDCGTTQGGIQYARFTVAVDRRSKDSNGNKQADFISCIAWRERANLLQNYFHKGSKIGIEGEIQTGSYNKNGQKVYTTDVIVNRIDFLDPYQGNGTAQAAPAPAAAPPPPAQQNIFTEVEDDELPFE